MIYLRHPLILFTVLISWLNLSASRSEKKALRGMKEEISMASIFERLRLQAWAVSFRGRPVTQFIAFKNTSGDKLKKLDGIQLLRASFACDEAGTYVCVIRIMFHRNLTQPKRLKKVMLSISSNNRFLIGVNTHLPWNQWRQFKQCSGMDMVGARWIWIMASLDRDLWWGLSGERITECQEKMFCSKHWLLAFHVAHPKACSNQECGISSPHFQATRQVNLQNSQPVFV